MRNILSIILNGIYFSARAVFWALPSTIRARLQGVRHGIVRRSRASISSLQVCSSNPSDINWQEFCSQVLSVREQFAQILIFEPTIDWGVALFQRPQHMALALARHGCLVIYRTTGDAVVGFREISPNVWLSNSREVDTINNAVWCFYSTSVLSSVHHMLYRKEKGRVIYEYIDHIDSVISGGKAEERHLKLLKNTALSGGCDFVVASARLLYDEIKSTNISIPVAYIPNAVDVTHYRDHHQEVQLSQNFISFRNTYKYIVGYFGAIAPWLWYDIITDLVKVRSDVGFVFIGPDYGGCIHRLPRLCNFLYLGPVNYSDLPNYARLFDVCLIPFSPGEVAQSTSPLKLFEYFALGKPVVVTSDMRECVVYREVLSGNGLAGYLNALEQAFRRVGDIGFRDTLFGLAEKNSWDNRAKAYLALINQ